MSLKKPASRAAMLASVAVVWLPLCAGAQTPLLSEVHTIATATSAVPVEHTFTLSNAGTYKVTLTDLGASLLPPAPLTQATMAVTSGDQVVGAPALLSNGTASLTLTAAANTTYTLHIVGSPASGANSGEINEVVTDSGGNTVEGYVDTLALPTPMVANGESILTDTFTVTTAGNYTITLTDLQVPTALQTLIMAVVPTGGGPIATFAAAGQQTVLLPAGSYQITAIGKAASGSAGGLFWAGVSGGSGSVPYPAKFVPVGTVTQLQSAALPADTYSATLRDLGFPNPLLSGNGALSAIVVRDDGLAVVTPLVAGTAQQFTVSSAGNNYLAFGVANPSSSSTAGSYSLLVQSTTATSAPAAINVAQAVAGASASVGSPFGFNTTIPTAASYTVTLTDFSFPGALSSVNLAAVQGGVVIGTPLAQVGHFVVNAAAGPLSLVAFSQASASGGVFGIDVSPSAGSSAVFDASQPVGLAFATRPLKVTTAGTYQVSAADVGFPAQFSSFDVLVTQGTQSVGQIYGGGQFNFTGTAGDEYILDFIALPSGTFSAGTYSLTVATAPPAPTVTLTSSAPSVSSGGTVTLTWTSQNATSCAASGGWSGSQATSGTATSPVITGATTFTLTCSGGGGTTAQSVSVSLNSPSPSGGHSGGGAINLLTLLGLVGSLLLRAAVSSNRKFAVLRSRSPLTRAIGALPVIKRIAASIVLLLPLTAVATDEASTASTSEPQPMAQIRTTMKERYPEAKIETITASKVLPGWYELVVGENDLVYVDATADRLIVGKVVDTKTRQNLTEKSWSDAHLIDFKGLPFDHSIKTVQGEGKRVVAIFEDPLCPYCQKLEQQMQNVQDVTIYRFLLPLESLHPGATVTARAIWCSKDRAAAWSDWMLKRTEPQAPKGADCNDPTGLTLQTAARYDLNATPTLVFADGHRLVGSVTPELLEKELQGSVAN